MTNDDTSDPGPTARAEELFAEFLCRREAGEEPDFEALLAEHPELADELRELRRSWERAEPRIQSALPADPDAPRARNVFGSDSSGSTSFRPAPGDRFGEFTLIRLLAEGGMGQVWEASQPSAGRRVALKFIRPERISVRAIKLFEREARAEGRLAHKNIVHVFETGEIDGVRYIAQEFVEGDTTLRDRIAAMRELAEVPDEYYREVAELFEQVADALAAVHEASVLHRDVKPSNILIAPDGTPKVTDFGLATIENEKSVSRTGETMGTYPYMSPEQVSAKNVPLDARTDVFSLGSTLYEALTLTRAFDGDAAPQIAAKVLFHEPPDPRAVRSRIPRDLAVVALHAIQKRRDARYESMDAMRADLGRFLAGEPIHARPPSVLRRAEHWVRVHPTLSAVLAIGIVALLVIGGLLRRERRLREETEAERERVLQLSDARRLEQLVRRAAGGLPSEPANLQRLERLLDDARALHANLDQHEHTRDAFRWETPAGDSAPPSELDAALRLRFDASPEGWYYNELLDLIDALDGLDDEEPLGVIADLTARVEFTRTVEERTVSGPDARKLWAEAIASIEDSNECPVYASTTIEPQIGLLPLGRDPDSGLWEFWMPETGSKPLRGDDGRLLFDGDTAIVFVLVPPGVPWLGAQKDDPDEPNFDELAEPDESPVYRAHVSMFFLAKYELTQGQWWRVHHSNPAANPAGREYYGRTATLAHPVELVSWIDSVALLSRLGLRLPSEAEWEYACRGGTDSAWWTGDDMASQEGAGNYSDFTFRDEGGLPGWYYAPWRDGHTLTAPAGTYLANPWGFFDLTGNVFEWCQDYYFGDYRPRGADARPNTAFGPTARIVRGTAWYFEPIFARSANRFTFPQSVQNPFVGVRAARALDP